MEYDLKDIEIDGNSYRVIHLKEDSIGLTNLNEIKELIEKELGEGKLFFALDLAEVNSINSSGLGILISCYKSIKSSDGDLKLINANDKLLNIFKITKLDRVFDLGQQP